MVIISFDVVLLFAIEKLDTKRHYRGEQRKKKNTLKMQKVCRRHFPQIYNLL